MCGLGACGAECANETLDFADCYDEHYWATLADCSGAWEVIGSTTPFVDSCTPNSPPPQPLWSRVTRPAQP